MTIEERSAEECARAYDHYDPAFVIDPHGTWARMRRERPVGHSDSYGGFTVLTKYDDIWRVYHEPQTFSSYPISIPASMGQTDRMIPVEIDPPEHVHYRRIVDPLFGPKRSNELEPSLREHARQLVENIVAKGECDFMAELPCPTRARPSCRSWASPLRTRTSSTSGRT